MSPAGSEEISDDGGGAFHQTWGGACEVGRRECALLDDLVSAIRRGESRSLVLRGEAGIGKTALLEYLIASAPDATVVRAVGVQSDMKRARFGYVDAEPVAETGDDA